MEDIRDALSKRLKTARQEAGLKQDQVARYLQISTSAVSTLESGQRKVEALELFQLSKLYAKPLEWFFEEEHPLSGRGSRWYDNDPLIREMVFLLGKVSPDLRKRAAYGILGFLSDR